MLPLFPRRRGSRTGSTTPTRFILYLFHYKFFFSSFFFYGRAAKTDEKNVFVFRKLTSPNEKARFTRQALLGGTIPPIELKIY